MSTSDEPSSGTLAKLGGRSFVLCVGFGLVCSVLLWFGKLTDGSYLAIILSTVGAYISSVTYRHRSEVRADVDKTVAAAAAAETQQGQP